MPGNRPMKENEAGFRFSAATNPPDPNRGTPTDTGGRCAVILKGPPGGKAAERHAQI